METVLHLFRHGQEDAEHRKTAPGRTGGRLTRQGVGEVINSTFLLRERIPDKKGVEAHFVTSPALRAYGVVLGGYHTMRAKYKAAKLHAPKVDDELGLPNGDKDASAKMFEKLGRDAYMQQWAAGKLSSDMVEPLDNYNHRIIENTLVKAVEMSKAKGKGEKHLVVVTHDGGSKVVCGFGAVFEHMTKRNPQEVSDEVNRDSTTGKPYVGPMRTGEYIGVHARNGVVHLVEFRGKWFAPGKKGEQWKEVERG